MNIFAHDERVKTPAHGEGIIIGYHTGPARGRQWREPRYEIRIRGLGYAVWYYESELASVRE